MQGYGRKGAALHGLGSFEDAIKVYEEGLKIEPALSMLTNGLVDAKRELERDAAGLAARVRTVRGEGARRESMTSGCG